MRLQNEVAIITGGGSGMGRAGAIRFAKEGASIVVVDLNEAGAQETAELVKAEGGKAVALSADISTLEGNQAAVDAALKNFGKLSIFWANAGIATAVGPLANAEQNVFERMNSVNVIGPWNGAKAAMPHLAKEKGSFLITASLSGVKPRPGNAAYSATKGAAIQLARVLAVEFAPNVRVNCLSPVATETPMQQVFTPGDLEAEMKPKIIAGVPMGRLATTDDIANAALFLVSREAEMITGHNLPVDGGALC